MTTPRKPHRGLARCKRLLRTANRWGSEHAAVHANIDPQHHIRWIHARRQSAERDLDSDMIDAEP
jgi:hypothetical protein